MMNQLATIDHTEILAGDRITIPALFAPDPSVLIPDSAVQVR